MENNDTAEHDSDGRLINPYTGKPYKTITKIQSIPEFVESRMQEPGGLSAIKALFRACLEVRDSEGIAR